MFFAPACSGREQAAKERVKPVKTLEIAEQTSPSVLSYSGIVSPGELKELSFKSSGRIGKIHVEKGQSIKKGDVLAELEDQDLRFALAAAEGQMEAARSAYEKALNGATAEEIKNAELNEKKARDAYTYALNNYKRAEALYTGGAISKNELEKAKLEADVRESELQQAKEALSQVKNGARSEDEKALLNQLKQAQADYEYKAGLVKDAVMTSDVDGYVVDILYERGELAPAGYPVAVVRTGEIVVNVGLSEKDAAAVKPGAKARIISGEKAVDGTVASVSHIPDAQTRTYNAEISVPENSMSLGAVVKADIITGSETGIWIPLVSMLSDGTDYVYLAKDGIAVKREVVIESVTGKLVKVKGLSTGERLVIEGMKSLKAGDRISIQN